MTKTLIDNDCALKTCRLDLVDELIGVCGAFETMHVLEEARFVFHVNDLERARAMTGSDAATTRLRDFLNACETVAVYSDTPIFSELSGYTNIDAGEAIIFAASLEEVDSIVFTGDKRAIQAFASFVKTQSLEDKIFGRVKCYEQIIAEMIETTNFANVAGKIRSDLDADKSLRACFRSANDDDVIYGLSSYYRNLSEAVPGLLAEPPRLITSVAA